MAGSPVRHESAVQGSAVEVQTYQPPWKALSDFALQSDLEPPAAFQQLVSPGHGGERWGGGVVYGRAAAGLTAAAPPGLLLRVRLFGHVLRQRRDLAVLPAPRHPQQHGAQPGRDVRPPGPRRRGTSACRAPCMRHPAPRRAQRAGRAPLSFNYSYLKPNRTYLADGRKAPGFSLPSPDRREKERASPRPAHFVARRFGAADFDVSFPR